MEAKAIEKRCQGPVEFKAWRFSFFACPVTYDLLMHVSDEDYLGYVIFIRTVLPDTSLRCYIYESVIAEPAYHKHGKMPLGNSLPAHYTHCIRRYSSWVGKRRFTLSGSFFSQQNGLTHVCAHAALRWLLNNIPERVEKIVSYEEINQDLNIDHSTNKVGQYGDDLQAEGLLLDNLLDVLTNRGYKYLSVNFENPVGRPQPYWRFMYSIIESGYPVLVFFTAPPARHVICAVGHTFNSDIWDDEAKLAYSGAPRMEYLSSASWVDHFIIHDDNYGMYFCMPSKALYPTTGAMEPFQVTGALGIVPANIELLPLDAEVYASAILRTAIYEAPLKDCYWLRALRQEEASFGKWVVLRTLFTNKAIYKNHLLNIEGVEGNVLTKREIETVISEKTPEHFWVTEVTLTDLYTANKRKLGEVLLKLSDPRINPDDKGLKYTMKLFSACIAIRIPGNILIPEISQNQLKIKIYETNLTEHVPLFRPCLKEPLFEW